MNTIICDPKRIDTILDRGVIAEILPSKEEFRARLLKGEPLRFYHGIDPTSTSLHLGHGGNLILLEEFRALGHEIILVMGDFTARIGDPSGKTTARRPLSLEQIGKNVSRIKKQLEKALSLKDSSNPATIAYNSSWLSKLNLEDLVSLSSRFTVQQMLERDMFKQRITEEKPIHLHEFLYPLMQGYDSVALETDVEIGGTDQTFNMLAGRTLLRQIKDREKFVIAVKLLANPKTGELMSKSKGTGIFLDLSPKDMFGRIMNVPDEMIRPLAITNTRLDLEEVDKLSQKASVGGKDARDAKIVLAREIVGHYHSPQLAQQACDLFIETFSKGNVPDKIKSKSLSVSSGTLLDIVYSSGLVPSKNEARRLIDQGAIEINGKTAQDPNKVISLEKEITLRVGKHRFIRITK